MHRSTNSGSAIDAIHYPQREAVIIEEPVAPLGAVEFLEPYVKGYPDKTFRPKKSITRAELSAIFARVLGLDLSNPGPEGFSDLDKDGWHYNYIQALAKEGILKGYKDGTFKPNKAITHAEAASIIAGYWEYLGIEVPEEDSGLKDIKGNWAEMKINKIVNACVTEGFGENSFFPNHMTTREQMVKMVNKLLDRPMIDTVLPTYNDVDEDYVVFSDIESASYKALKKVK